jgi:hypothetical protein
MKEYSNAFIGKIDVLRARPESMNDFEEWFTTRMAAKRLKV